MPATLPRYVIPIHAPSPVQCSPAARLRMPCIAALRLEAEVVLAACSTSQTSASCTSTSERRSD